MSAGKLKRGTQESEVEKYLVEQVELHGGIAEKFHPPPKGRPDRIVTWPAYGFARVHFVELKTIGGKLESWQERDHARRRKLGCHVFVIWTKNQVDDYIRRFSPKLPRCAECMSPDHHVMDCPERE
jgi:hypothetical protein